MVMVMVSMCMGIYIVFYGVLMKIKYENMICL